MTRVEQGRGWTMYHADNRDIFASLADKSVDVVITDAPYEPDAHTKARRRLKDATQKRGARNTGEVRRLDEPIEMSFEHITDAERTAAAREFARICRRWSMAFCQIEAVGAWRIAFEAAGLDWVRGGIWHKPNGTPQFTGDRPGQGFECLAIAHPRGRKRWNGGGAHAFWSVPLEREFRDDEDRNEHTTKKPEALMVRLVELFTDPGETVLDPYAGSATTGVACLRLGRQFIGVEQMPRLVHPKDPDYFTLACERLRAEEHGSTRQAARAGQTALFGGSK